MGTPKTIPMHCADIFFRNIGVNYTIGAAGSTPYHFLQGLQNSPKSGRLVGGVEAVCLHAPRVGGYRVVTYTLYKALEQTLFRVRKKDDAWNAIIATSATFGLVESRRGVRASATADFVGGAIVAFHRGLMFVVEKKYALQKRLMIVADRKIDHVLTGNRLPTPPISDASPLPIPAKCRGIKSRFGHWWR